MGMRALFWDEKIGEEENNAAIPELTYKDTNYSDKLQF